MPLQNDFILFGSTASNIDSQAAYAADTNTANGRPSGTFPSNVFNKIARQSSYASSALAQLINTYAVQGAIDNGNLTQFTNNLVAAIQAIATSGAPVAPPGLPGGRLTLTTGVPLIGSDVTGSTVVYYTPFNNASFPLFNGSSWTNPHTITLINGGTTYASIPAGQATYLGSLAIDSVAGQTSCYVSYGQSRK